MNQWLNEHYNSKLYIQFTFTFLYVINKMVEVTIKVINLIIDETFKNGKLVEDFSLDTNFYRIKKRNVWDWLLEKKDQIK